MNMSKLSFDKTGFLIARILMGGVFVYASYDKILHPRAFAEAVYNYQILPDAMINATALALPWIELIAGACLIAGVWLPGASLVTTLLMASFAGALVFNQIRGLDVHCGCFSTQTTHGEPSGIWTLVRDICFLALCLYLLVRTVFSQNPIQRIKS
ncbi:MAG: MauE/DoxX family redox-associated membrane protein [Desulfobacteraceae bacterium]